MNKLPVLKIQRFSTHDGPGIRTTVFLQGCPLRCKWCHNPESQEEKPDFFYTPALCVGCGACASACPQNAHLFEGSTHQIDRNKCVNCLKCTDVCLTKALEKTCERRSVEEIAESVKKDLPFYGKDGGLTISGGEPLLHAEEAIALLEEAKRAGVGTAVETCGYFDGRYVNRLVRATDLFLWDLKDSDEKRYIANTGVSNGKILKNLFAVDEAGGKTVLRCILLNGVNANERHLEAVAAIYKRLRRCQGVEIFSYHAYGESKYAALGKSYHGNREWIVPKKELKRLQNILKNLGVPCKIT